MRALDWGVELSADGLTDEYTHIGVKSRMLRPTDAPGENTFPCRVQMVVEDETQDVVVLSTPAGTEGYSRLRMETEKGLCRAAASGGELLIHIPRKGIMPLRES